ncbi:hypothetical protein PFDG_00439 [Plasmodium falciparum Dd2]|uniref:Diacylglycerol kinase (ATP) n=1 Tax=Plasmodium falciparum (isolate Dd2) TaxID=57267 RepID=A0A0L7LWR0_PLAF4|nr:hypothetical protein PFDG_00439 [Plasmodium falciparum Dd2]
MEDFAYIDKNVYINILLVFIKKIKDYIVGIGILKILFCVCIILLSIFIAKRKNKKKKKIHVYLQLNRKKNNSTKVSNSSKKSTISNEDEISQKNLSKISDNGKLEEISNGYYHLTYTSHIFNLKTINRIELCNVCEENIYSFFFHKKNIFECIMCRNKCHIECAPNSNLMSCKTSVFFKNKHKFIKLRNCSWNDKCDICDQKFYFFSLYTLLKRHIYKCIWCNKYFHLRCLIKNSYKKKKIIKEDENVVDTQKMKNLCTYGNNEYILYPYQLTIKENVLIDFLISAYNKVQENDIKLDDIFLSYTLNDFYNLEKKFKKDMIEPIEHFPSYKFRSVNDLLYFDYVNHFKSFRNIKKKKKKKIIQIHLNFLLNFFPVHLPIYHIKSNKTFLLIFVNVKSGGQTGKNLYQELLMYFNPIQIINIKNEKNVLNALNMFKQMFYLKKIILLICGGDGTISIFIDTLIKFFLKQNSNNENKEQVQKNEQVNKEPILDNKNKTTSSNKTTFLNKTLTNITEKIRYNKDLLKKKWGGGTPTSQANNNTNNHMNTQGGKLSSKFFLIKRKMKENKKNNDNNDNDKYSTSEEDTSDFSDTDDEDGDEEEKFSSIKEQLFKTKVNEDTLNVTENYEHIYRQIKNFQNKDIHEKDDAYEDITEENKNKIEQNHKKKEKKKDNNKNNSSIMNDHALI